MNTSHFIRSMQKILLLMVASVALVLINRQNVIAQAVERNDVLVLINSQSPRSVRVGLYYAERRKIAASNIVYLDCPLVRDLSIADYLAKIENPLIQWFSSHPSIKINYITLSQDFPFVVTISGWRGGNSLETILGYMATKKLQDYLVKNSSGQYTGYAQHFYGSTYFGSEKYLNEFTQPPVFITARLEARSEQQAKGLVDKAIYAEQQGLTGKSYILPGLENDYSFLQKNAERNIEVHQAMQKMIGGNYAFVDNYTVDPNGNVKGLSNAIGDPGSKIRESYKEVADNALFYYGGFTNYVGNYYDVFKWAPGSLAFDLHIGDVAQAIYPLFYEWQGNYIAVTDPNAAHKGNNCILFDNSEVAKRITAVQSTFSWNYVSGGYGDVPTTLNQTAPKSIIVGAWAKTAGVPASYYQYNFVLLANVKYTDNTTDRIDIFFPGGTSAWTEYSKKFTPPKPIKNISMTIIFDVPGKVWIDDLYIVEEDNSGRNIMESDNWNLGYFPERHYPGFEFDVPSTDPNYWRAGKNFLSRQFAFEAIERGAAGSMGKSQHDEYWRGGENYPERAKDNKTLEYFLKGFSFGEALWMTSYVVPTTHIYLGDPLYNPTGVYIKSIRDNASGSVISVTNGKITVTKDQILQISGSAFNGALFTNYTLEYLDGNGVAHSDGITLTNGGKSAVKRSVLGTWNLASVPPGLYSLKLTVKNSSGQNFYDYFNVEVSPNNYVIAVSDDAALNQGGNVVVDLLANDLYPATDPASISTVMQGQNGRVDIIDKTHVKYTPNPIFYGADSFVYTIKIASGKSSSALVNVKVNSYESQPPVFTTVPGAQTVKAGTEISFYIKAEDPEGEKISYSSPGLPSGAILTDVLMGDFNGDGAVDVWDSDIFMPALNVKKGDANYNPILDLNSDGVINLSDYDIYLGNKGKTINSAMAKIGGLFRWKPANTQNGAYNIVIQATDVHNKTGQTNVNVTVIDDKAPIATITSLKDGAQIPDNAPLVVAGTASSSIGIKFVIVTIVDTANPNVSLFEGAVFPYDGANWDTSKNISPTGVAINSIVPASSLIPGHTIEIYAQPKDTAKNWGATTKTTVTVVDKTPPNMTIVSPSNGTFVSSSTSLIVTGTASDNVALQYVYLDIYDITDNNKALYSGTVFPYDGVNWSTANNRNSASGVVPANLLIPGHTIGISAGPKDKAKNWGTNQTITVSVIDKTPPSMTIVSPSNGTFVSSSTSLIVTGTASDNVALQFVYLDIYDITDNNKELYSGTVYPYDGVNWSTANNKTPTGVVINSIVPPSMLVPGHTIAIEAAPKDKAKNWGVNQKRTVTVK